MTCIVGIVQNGTVYIGGDSAVTTNAIMSLKARKVFRLKDFLLGYSGSVRMLQLLQHAFEPPEHPEDMSTEEYLTRYFIDGIRNVLKDAGNATKESEQEYATGYFLVGYRGQLFTIGSDYSLSEFNEDYYAIGSGGDVALGSLHSTQASQATPEERILAALEAAATHCNGVRAPFCIETLKSLPTPVDLRNSLLDIGKTIQRCFAHVS